MDAQVENSAPPDEEVGRFRISDPKFRARALSELGETDELRMESLATLKRLITEDPHISAENLPDTFLIICLRTSKFHVQAAFNRVKKLSQMMSHQLVKSSAINSETCDVDRILYILRQCAVAVPDKLDEYGRKIVTVRTAVQDTDNISPLDVVSAVSCLLISIASLEEESQVGGFVLVFDFKGTGLRHAKKCTPTVLNLCGTLLQSCCPVRVKQIHTPNMGLFVRAAMNIVMAFLGKKIRSRIFIHGSDYADLRMNIPAEFLPEEYGGSCPDIKQSETYIKNSLQKGVDSGLIPGILNLRYNKNV